MKNEEKIEVVATTRRKSFADTARYNQHMSYKKNKLLVCDKSMSSPPNLRTISVELSNSSNLVTNPKDFIELSLKFSSRLGVGFHIRGLLT